MLPTIAATLLLMLSPAAAFLPAGRSFTLPAAATLAASRSARPALQLDDGRCRCGSAPNQPWRALKRRLVLLMT